MRDLTIPTPHEQRLEQLIEEMRDIAEQSEMFLQTQLQSSVQTLDTIVYEHDTVELPVGQETYSLKLQPQTSQVELITGIFAAITVPDLVAAPTITLTNAWAQLGRDLVNLNAILNSSGGTGGALPGNFSFILNADDKRTLNVVASADWPVGAYITYALFGVTVPATLGEVLH
jgi:hypothetical protein